MRFADNVLLPDPIYRIMLDWFMASDPWPIDQAQQEEMEKFLTAEGKARGFESWVDAYHQLRKQQ